MRMTDEAVEKFNVKQWLSLGEQGEHFDTNIGHFIINIINKDVNGNPRISIQPIGRIDREEMPSLSGFRVNRKKAIYTTQSFDKNTTVEKFLRELSKTGIRF